MKTYVMIFGIANVVAGGPIYNSNKIRFLESIGWNVIVFSTNTGNVYIKPLEKYKKNSYDFLHFSPYILGKRKTDKFVNIMANNIPPSEELIVETGTDYTALWGELLAKKIKARHIVMFLDEKNENVNKYSSLFYEFKYKRNELYSISQKSLTYIFSPYFKIEEPEKNVWNAWCTNSVEKIETDIIELLPDADYMIGSIGRLDKSFVSNIIDGVGEFADKHKDASIGLCLFGGADNKTISRIRKAVQMHHNVTLYISGYIWPIPSEIFPKFDVFISGAGAANVSANMGISTINMDVITNEPTGLIDNPSEFHSSLLNGVDNTIQNYLTSVLIEKAEIEIHGMVSIEKKWEIICKDFDNQLNQVEAIEAPLIYFDTSKIWDHKRIHKIQSFIARLTSYRLFITIKKIYSWFKGYGFEI